MKKRALSLLLVLSMVLTMVPAAFAASYTDTEDHWAEASIERWSEYGIVEGVDGLFDPNGQLTRAQLAAIIARLLKLPEAESAGFGDTSGHWAEDVINRCAAAGIMQGDGVSARPNDTVSREETMVMLGRALGIKPVENADLTGYGDSAAVASWAAGYVAALTEAGIVNGIDGNLEPDADINRASTMAILDRAITTYVTEPGTTVEAKGGIVVVAAENVTITGEAAGVVITEAAAEGTTTLTNAEIGTVTVQAAETSVVVGQGSEVENLDMTKQAAGTEVKVSKGAAVDTVTTAAPESTVTVSGTVGNVEVAESADNTTVAGSGKVESVTTSGDNTSVETNGTKVEVSAGTTGTTAGGQAVTGGTTSTTPNTTPEHICVIEKTIVTPPTCTEKGYTTKISCCGDTYVEDETDMYIHQDGVECPHCKLTEVKTAAGLATALANGGSNVVLLENIELAETTVVAEGKTVVLDLNGKSITMEESIISTTYAISNLGTLTIKDTEGTGSVNSRGIYNGYLDGTIVDTAKLTIESGTYNAMGTNGGAAVFNYGVADIKGGAFTSVGGYSLSNQSGSSMTVADGVSANNGIYCSNAALTVNGGEISGNRSGCHVVYSWNSILLINGGTFYNYNSGNATVMAAGTTVATINGGTFGIKDGRVPGNGNTWTSCLTDTANSAKMTVTGGTFNGGFRVQAGSTMIIEGGSFNDCYGSNYNIYGTVEVKGGTYTDDAAKNFAKSRVANGYYCVPDAGGSLSVFYIGDNNLQVVEGKLGLMKGTENDYYVFTAAGLEAMNSMMVDKSAGKAVVVNLMADIDFTGKTWTTVDSHADTAFTMKEINGNGHTISNLTINGQAMFSRFAGTGDVTIKNITFDGATVNTSGINASILTVQTYQNVLLDNVDVKNSSITGAYKVAPLIGTVYNESASTITATLKNCDVSDTTVKATSYDYCTTGMVAFVYADDNDQIVFENCTVSNVQLYAPNVYTAHAAIYTTGSETLFDEAEGVTVTNVTFENI